MASFEARYHGECGYGDRIRPGEELMYDDTDTVVHVQCHRQAFTGEVPDDVEAVCPECHTLRPCWCD